MITTSEIAKIRRIRWENPTATLGLVPTMGYLHEGHMSLVERARRENDFVGVSIFVNPLQFNDPKDLQQYPRDTERDLRLLREAGVDLVWTPTPEDVYPPGFQTHVEVEEISRPLEGASRPGHFRGVATVVCKLFNIFQPTRAYFGQKDAQQVAVVRQMVADLNFNLELVVCPTIREPDGLAMSSRNARLRPEARKQALCLYRALCHARERIAAGETDASRLKKEMAAIIAREPLAKVDYISFADPDTLREQQTIAGPVLISLAAFIDGIRLIDNMLLQENHGDL